MTKTDIFNFENADGARALQRELSVRVKCEDDLGFRPQLLCGIDASYEGETAFIAATVWDTVAGKAVETAKVIGKVAISYVPGLLAFREGPLLVSIAEKLKAEPDVFLIDGHGVAHPRGFGLASHVGLALDKPAIGVAKSLLYGTLDGDRITDSNGGVIGSVLKTETGKRYYVSVGHRISLDTAVKLVKRCMSEGFPVPLRRAHLDSIFLKGSWSA